MLHKIHKIYVTSGCIKRYLINEKIELIMKYKIYKFRLEILKY